MAFMQIDSLVKRYGDTAAVDGVSLSIDEGYTTAIIGASGCGKSTFLRCVNLLEPPTSGTLSIGDDTVAYADGTLSSGRERMLSIASRWQWCSRASICFRICRCYAM